MGKHRKIQPKRISMLATTGGLFATVLLAAGLFGAAQIITSDRPHNETPAKEIIVPVVPEINRTNGTINTPEERTQETATQIPQPTTKQIPRSKQTPGTAIPGPTVPPAVIAPPTARVETPVVDVEVNAQPLIGLLTTSTDTVKDVVTDVTGLLGK